MTAPASRCDAGTTGAPFGAPPPFFGEVKVFVPLEQKLGCDGIAGTEFRVLILRSAKRVSKDGEPQMLRDALLRNAPQHEAVEGCGEGTGTKTEAFSLFRGRSRDHIALSA
jgi:hypothetical protein